MTQRSLEEIGYALFLEGDFAERRNYIVLPENEEEARRDYVHMYKEHIHFEWIRVTEAHRHLEICTPEQASALSKLYLRTEAYTAAQSSDAALRQWRYFLAKARTDRLLGCVMVPFAGMAVGIEKDGYTHS